MRLDASVSGCSSAMHSTRIDEIVSHEVGWSFVAQTSEQRTGPLDPGPVPALRTLALALRPKAQNSLFLASTQRRAKNVNEHSSIRMNQTLSMIRQLKATAFPHHFTKTRGA